MIAVPQEKLQQHIHTGICLIKYGQSAFMSAGVGANQVLVKNGMTRMGCFPSSCDSNVAIFNLPILPTLLETNDRYRKLPLQLQVRRCAALH